MLTKSLGVPLMAPMSPVIQREVPGIDALALSPEGQYMAMAGDQGVEIRAVSGNQGVTALQQAMGEVHSLRFSPDGRYLAVGGYREVGVWDSTTGENLWVSQGHTAEVFAMAFSPDGKILVTGSRGEDRTLLLWDAAAGNSVGSLSIDTPYADQTRALVFSPDGRTLAYTGLDGRIRLWDITRGEQIKTLEQEGHLPFSLAYHPGGKFLASGGRDGGVLIWDISTGEPVGRISMIGHVVGMAFNQSGSRLTVGSDDGTVRYVDTAAGQVQKVRHMGMVPAFTALTPDGESILSYGDGRLALFSLREQAGLPPVIALLTPSESIHQIKEPRLLLTAKIVDDQGIADVRVTLNGARVAGDSARKTRDLVLEESATSGSNRPTGREWNLTQELTLVPGDNRIVIYATDVEGLEGRKELVLQYEEEKGKVWAAVIGISRYDHHSIAGLKYADADARAFYNYLIKDNGVPPDHVTLLLNEEATLQKIKDVLGVEIKGKARKEDTVIIYYAGHGVPEADPHSPDEDGLEKYLLPNAADPQRLYSTALPMAEISRIFSRLAAERVILIQDTCYSGASGGRTIQTAGIRAAVSDRYLDRLTQGKGRVIMTASGPSEVSIEKDDLGHGVFTYYLLESFRYGDLDGDGIITLGESYRYVSRKVPDATDQNQHPMKKGEEAEGEMAIGKAIITK